MANIRINSTPTRVQYTATSGQTVFSYTFPIKADSDLKVYKRAANANPNDADDLLTITTHYTVTGANTANGGTIVLVSGATLGDIITIVGDKAIDRTAIYDQNVTISKSDLNNDFNNLTMYVKQLETKLDQLTPSYPRSASIGPNTTPDKLVLPVLDNDQIWRGTSTGITAFTINGELVGGPVTSTLNSIAVWNSTTGDSLDDTTIKINGNNFEPVTAGQVIGINDTSAFQLPSGTTLQRPSGANGRIRYNSSLSQNEIYEGGDWHKILNASSGAPIDLTYITASDETAVLTNSQSLGALSSGLLKNTVISSVGSLDTAVEGADYYKPGGTDVAVIDGGTGASTASGARTNLGLGTIATQDASNVSITGGSLAGITDLAVADGGTGASTAAGARTNLGLGTIATQDANNVTISGGSISGITDLAVADGGTGASTAANARTNLGIEIGTDVQAFNAGLKQIADLVDPNEDRLLFWDDSAGKYDYLTLGTNIAITGTTINVTGDGSGSVTSVATGTGLTGGPITTTGTINLDFNGLTAKTTPVSTDYAVIYDVAGSAPKKALLSNWPYKGTVTSVASGSGLTGGPVTGTGTLSVDINGQSEDTSPDGSADFVMTYDTSASGIKKVLLNNLPTASSGSSMVLISTATASSSSSIDFVSGIGSTYDVYMITISGLVVATNDERLLMRFSTDGGSTWKAGASDYRNVGRFESSNTASSNYSSSGTTALYLSAPSSTATQGIGNGSGKSVDAVIYVYHPSNSALTTRINYLTCYTRSTAETVRDNGAGEYLTAAAINGIRILGASGNLTSGKIRLYGIKNT